VGAVNMPAVDNLIRDFVTQDISAALESFEITKKVEHQGLKGKAREIFVQRLFESLLSHDFRSRETDVILYCPEIMPARDPDNGVDPVGWTSGGPENRLTEPGFRGKAHG
jgi:hypothetical protein